MSSIRLALACVVALTVAACGAQREVRVLNNDGTEVPTARANSKASVRGHAGIAPPARGKTASLPPRPLPTAAEIAAAPNPLALKGEAATAVKAALGTATLLRREPPAQVWQYRGRTCVLDLVLYPDEKEGAPLTVAHVELRPIESATKVSPKACAADVRQARTARS